MQLGVSSDIMELMRIYHGNPLPDFMPFYGGGKDYHDYGKGLYCTEDFAAAKEWACQHIDITASYVYVYDLNLVGLAPLLDLINHEPVYWLSALAQYRYGQNESNARRERRLRFIELFPVNCEDFEVIIGWRADDRYFAYLNAFLGLDISYEAVTQAMKLGDLGQQVVLKGKTAFSNYTQVDKILISGADYAECNAQSIERERNANIKLQQVRDIPGRMLNDIIAKGGL